MKDLDSALSVILSADEADLFFLIDMVVPGSSNFRRSSLDIDIYYDGNLFQSMDFTITPINYSMGMSVDEIRVDISNVHLEISSILLNTEVRNSEFILYIGAMDNFVPRVEELFRGLVSNWELDEDKGNISIVNEFVFWNKKTLRQCSALCPWVFKGIECGYSEAQTSCNKTYIRCGELNRTDNFGGFRFLPSLEEKQIVWGK